MVAQLQVTGKHTLDVKWMLTEEQISELRANDASGTRCSLESDEFGNDAWYLELDSLDPDFKKPYLYLHANPLREDGRLATSTKAWQRKGHFQWSISLVSKEPIPQIQPRQIELENDFHSKATGCGDDFQVTVKQILNIYDKQKSFGFRCVLTGDHFPQFTSLAHDATHDFFDSSIYADTVLVVHQPGRSPLHIFACKMVLVRASSHFKTLFESGFSESTSRRRFDLEQLANHEKDDGSSTSASINQHLQPFYSTSEDATPQPPADHALNDENNSSTEISSNERSRKRIKLEEGTEETSSEAERGKLMNVIDMHGTDFRTFRALISHLHTPVVPFLPVASNFLVEHFNNDELSQSRPLDWLQKKFEELVVPLEWGNLKPCCAHAMYRLSDYYDVEDLRELSLGFIIRSLTIENVSYELFSPLSLDFEAVQKPILEFFVKNWSDVRKTKGFNVVFEQFSLGKLAKGKDLMRTIYEMISQS